MDFRGGTLMYVRFEPKPAIDELRKALSARLKGEISVQETQGTGEFIPSESAGRRPSLEQARLAVEQTLRDKYASLGGKLDLNNANPAALEERLRRHYRPLASSSMTQSYGTLTAGILSYRDREKNGLVSNLDELTKVSGVNENVLAAHQAGMWTGYFQPPFG